MKVTKDGYEFGKQNRMLYYPTLPGEILPIAVNFDKPVEAAASQQGSNINLTLPL